MKTGINFISFHSYQGTETFAKNLISELAELNPDSEYLIFTTPYLPKEMTMLTGNARKIPTNINPKHYLLMGMYQQLILPFKLAFMKVTIFYAPMPSIPVLFSGRKIITIHDCAYDRFSEFRSSLSKLYIKLMYSAAKYFCDTIITVSQFSKKELITLYRIKPDKIAVIYHGVPIMPDVDSTFIEHTKALFNINTEYFMYIGNTRPRKNIDGLLNAFQLFSKKHRDIKLVLAGKTDDSFVNIEDRINSLNIRDLVIQTDFISEEQKTALYRGALALVFPSYYEGFGLPVLEAQSLGTPVLTSNTSSLPEIGGKGALYVDPSSTEQIAGGMEKLLDEQARQELIRNGYENIKRFSWKTAARQLDRVLKTLS